MYLTRKSLTNAEELIIKEQRQFQIERLKASPSLFVGGAVFLVILAVALLQPVLPLADPNAMTVADRLTAPCSQYLLGTDEYGRDVLSRLVAGARVSLWVGGCVTLFSCAIGTVVGLLSSYFKVLDAVLMRICDGLIAIPGILLAIALIAALGTSSWNVVIALTVVYTSTVARTVRASAMVVREQPYVEAAKAQGFGSLRILVKMVLPGVLSSLLVQASFIFAQAIISEAALSFLGAGIPAPAASWGNMLEASRDVFSKAPWTMIVPGVSVVLCVLSLNLLGDGLRDFLDPRLKAGAKK